MTEIENSQPFTSPAVLMKSGTFNFWIDRDTKPDAFESGSRCRWAAFEIEGEKCVVCSDGPTLTATVGMGEENQRRLFRIPFAPSFRRRHMVTIGWSKGAMKVILDSKVIARVPITFLIWLFGVCGVLWAHASHASHAVGK